MNIYIRADSSSDIGSGHIMRCLALADLLVAHGHKVSFICRQRPGNLSKMLLKLSYPVFLLNGQGDFDWEQDAAATAAVLENGEVDWLIVDHYGIDDRWEQHQRQYSKIMVIDDLANRKHDCDILLDQNLYKNKMRYQNLIPLGCVQLLGPHYALLRKEFDIERSSLKKRDGSVEKLVVFMGGGDADNVTGKVLEALQLFDYGSITIDVVVGAMNPRKEQIKAECSHMRNVRFYCQVENMARLLGEADLAVGAGGSSTWERCFLGLPCLTILIAENQIEMTETVAEYGAIWNLGWHKSVEPCQIALALKHMLANPLEVKRVSDNAVQLMKDNPEGRRRIVTELGGN